MKRILIIGSGDIALRTIPLLAERYRVYALIRNPDYRAKLKALGATPIVGDLDNRKRLARIRGLADIVLHFAPPGTTGKTDARTRNLLAALSQADPDKTTSHSTKLSKNDSQVAGYEQGRRMPLRLVYISTSGVYGDCGGGWAAEARPVNPASSRGKLRVDAERQIRAWGRRNQVIASILRVPGIYAAERLPLERIRSGAPAILEAEDSYSNHIHADDLARIAVAALHRGKSCRVYHATDDDEMKMGDYFDAVADAFCLPRLPRLSRDEVQRAVSPMMWSFMNESRRLTNVRMKNELKVALRYPTVASFLATKRPE